MRSAASVSFVSHLPLGAVVLAAGACSSSPGSVDGPRPPIRARHEMPDTLRPSGFESGDSRGKKRRETSQGAPPVDILGGAARLVRPVSLGALSAPSPLCGRATGTKFAFRAA